MNIRLPQWAIPIARVIGISDVSGLRDELDGILADATEDGDANKGQILKTNASSGALKVTQLTVLVPYIQNTGDGLSFLNPLNFTDEREHTLPNASGTLALTDQTDGSIKAASISPVEIIESNNGSLGGTAILDLSSSHFTKMIRFTGSDACNITLPAALGATFEEIFLHRATGSGVLTLVPAGGVTVDNESDLPSLAEGGIACLKRRGTNAWILFANVPA